MTYTIFESYHRQELCNGTTYMYVGEILQADPCRTWPKHGLGEMLLRCRTFQKILLFLKFCRHTS